MVYRDFDGEEVPMGKVERRLEADFLTSSIPGWITKYAYEGTSTLTNRSISNSRGELALSIDDAKSTGLNLPQVDPTKFRELRVGAAFEITSGGSPWVKLGFADTDSGIVGTGSDAIFLDQEYNSMAYADLKNLGIEAFDTNYPWVTDGNSIVTEVRLRPFENGVTVLGGGADQVFWEGTISKSSYAKYYPKIETSGGTLEISKLWLDVIHN